MKPEIHGQLESIWHFRRECLRAGQARPVLQVISFHADTTNRGPTFDLDLSELDGPDGQPLSYADARQLLKSDPADRWTSFFHAAILVELSQSLQFHASVLF